MSTQPLRPVGTPAGGQWAPTAHDEADLELAPKAVPRDYYWWHRSLLKELHRIESNVGPLPSYNSKGLASNICDQHADVKRWLAQLGSWGLVEEAPPEWEVPGAKWYRLTGAGRALVLSGKDRPQHKPEAPPQ